jgi:hypothetical protein
MIRILGSHHSQRTTEMPMKSAVAPALLLLAAPAAFGQTPMPTPVPIAANLYTLSPADCSQFDEFTSNTPVFVTVPTGLPAGCDPALQQVGSGSVSVLPGAGMTPRLYNGGSVIAGQNAIAFIVVDETRTRYTVAGSVVAPPAAAMESRGDAHHQRR